MSSELPGLKPGEEDEECGLARTTTIFNLEPRAEVYVDEFSALFFDNIAEELKEDFREEYVRLLFLANSSLS